MKNSILISSLAILLIAGCANSNPTKEEVKESLANMNETSSLLANLPVMFKGVIGAANYDSVLITLTLQTNTEYTLNKEFYVAGKKDTFDNEKGNWLIEGEDIIHVNADKKMLGFENFKVITKTQLELVDSLKNKILDGKNYIINKKEIKSETN